MTRAAGDGEESVHGGEFRVAHHGDHVERAGTHILDPADDPSPVTLVTNWTARLGRNAK